MELDLSRETLDFLADELEQMLCHCDLSETQSDELDALLGLLDTPEMRGGTIHLNLPA